MSRKRKRTPPDTFTGTTLEAWQSNLENVRWAASEPRVRQLLSVAVHSIESIAASTGGMSEGRAYGNVEGAIKLMNVLKACTERPARAVDAPEATFDERDGLTAADVRD